MFLEKPTDKITANDKERVLGRFPQHLNQSFYDFTKHRNANKLFKA